VNEGDVIKIMALGAEAALKLAGPPLIAALVVGVAMSIFQAVFQVNDQSLPMVPKFLAIGGVLIAQAAWSLKVMSELVQELHRMLPGLLG